MLHDDHDDDDDDDNDHVDGVELHLWTAATNEPIVHCSLFIITTRNDGYLEVILGIRYDIHIIYLWKQK